MNVVASMQKVAAHLNKYEYKHSIWGWRTGDCLTVAAVLREWFGVGDVIAIYEDEDLESGYIHYVLAYRGIAVDGIECNRLHTVIKNLKAENGIRGSMHQGTGRQDDEVQFFGCNDKWDDVARNYMDDNIAHGDEDDLACYLLAHLNRYRRYLIVA